MNKSSKSMCSSNYLGLLYVKEIFNLSGVTTDISLSLINLKSNIWLLFFLCLTKLVIISLIVLGVRSIYFYYGLAY
jgi:hypothetical protein